MFRNRTNIVKKAVTRLAPNREKIKGFAKDFIESILSPNEFLDTRQVNIPPHEREPTPKDSKVRVSKKSKSESYYRDKLAKSLGGRTEVPISGGRIDVLTSTEIIEVKQIKKWREALGQILHYCEDYPNHRKRIHLFGKISKSDITAIKKTCQKFDVVVTWEEAI